MSFVLRRGKTVTRHLPMTVSTAVNKGDLAAWSGGKLVAAISTTAKENIAGVFVKTIASTDDDYATARKVGVLVPRDSRVQWTADVTSGLVAGDIGGYFDLTDAATVTRASSTEDIVQCEGVISTTKGIFRLNMVGVGSA